MAPTGAVIVDLDNDGWNDIYVTGSVGFSQMGGCNCEPNPDNPQHPQDGYWRVIASSSLPRMENHLYINVVFADVNGDGFSEQQVRVIQAGEGASGSMSEAAARWSRHAAALRGNLATSNAAPRARRCIRPPARQR